MTRRIGITHRIVLDIAVAVECLRTGWPVPIARVIATRLLSDDLCREHGIAEIRRECGEANAVGATRRIAGHDAISGEELATRRVVVTGIIATSLGYRITTPKIERSVRVFAI